MGYKCCVINCRIGYALPGSRSKNAPTSLNKNSKPVPLFSFPTDPARLEKWIRAIRIDQIGENGQRKPFFPTKQLCLLKILFVREEIQILQDYVKSQQQN